ncbi:hypothetical protein RRG08_021282 [Elysia crispata]|uniref:Uncharacterized protein n=1 Tax=Elysia crispata TaxID=231223 RepID=A0AAE0ZA82_9GAST|nr:hypothetical protein RRG08_021282 [Elysia crispata]
MKCTLATPFGQGCGETPISSHGKASKLTDTFRNPKFRLRHGLNQMLVVYKSNGLSTERFLCLSERV